MDVVSAGDEADQARRDALFDVMLQSGTELCETVRGKTSRFVLRSGPSWKCNVCRVPSPDALGSRPT